MKPMLSLSRYASLISMSSQPLNILGEQDRIEIYKLQRVNADNDHVDQELDLQLDPRYRYEYISKYSLSIHLLVSSPILLRQIPTDSHDACIFSPSTKLILFNVSEEGRRQLVSYNVHVSDDGDRRRSERPFVLWRSGLRRQDIASVPLQTSSIPLDFDSIVLGYCE